MASGLLAAYASTPVWLAWAGTAVGLAWYSFGPCERWNLKLVNGEPLPFPVIDPRLLSTDAMTEASAVTVWAAVFNALAIGIYSAILASENVSLRDGLISLLAWTPAYVLVSLVAWSFITRTIRLIVKFFWSLTAQHEG